MKFSARKLAVVAALAAFTTGVSGYFMARLQVDRAAAARSTSQIGGVSASGLGTNLKSEISAAPMGAAEAPRYAELGSRANQPNHAWRSSVATLPPAPAFTADTPALSREEIAALLATRASRRAYNGAPPTVPHPIDQSQSASCLACHGTPTRVDARDVPQMSHPLYTNCIQCHAPQHGPGPALALATPALANTFAGLPPPPGGTRAYTGAPPVMPHTTAMRQNCLSCHGPGGSASIKTTHPQRQNCLQCHATDASREPLPPPLSAPSAPSVPSVP